MTGHQAKATGLSPLDFFEGRLSGEWSELQGLRKTWYIANGEELGRSRGKRPDFNGSPKPN